MRSRVTATGRRGLFAVAAALLLVSACGNDSTQAKQSDTASPSTSAAAPKEIDAGVAQRLDAAIKQAITDASVPGVIVGLWGPDGQYIRSFGVADKATGAPMKTDFYSRIGSVTKTFTITGVLQLADQGKLGLDDPIAKYIDGVPQGDKITLRQLARMQSGLPNYSANPAFGKALFEDPRRPFTPQQLLDYSFSQPEVFPPGEGFQYSNTNTTLLGLVVEKLSGQALPDYIRDHITAPLGLSHTAFPTDNAFPDPHAQGYTDGDNGAVLITTDWNPSWGWAAGAMTSTLEDMHAWAPALATGKLLSPEMQAQRLQTVNAPGHPKQDGYGLGIFNLGGWIGHNGSLPGYQTVAVYLPEKQTTLVIFSNTDIEYKGGEPSTTVAQAITSIITPDRIYTLSPTVQEPDASPTPTSTTKPK
ncbi:MAG: penicillin-binding protein beta-lactamase class [Mycobacterium sp.]|nr:penicillin-binding protein beta-lactamase class [Mycobacterium sp.]